MNICYFLGTLNRGGTETLALDVCRNVHLFSNARLYLLSRKEGNMDALFAQTQVPKQVIKTRGRLDILYLVRLRKYMRANQIDVIHAHQPIDAVYAFLATLALPIKIACTHHGGFAKGLLNKAMLRLSIKIADQNFFVSRSCLNLYKDHLRTQEIPRATVLYNGIAIDRICKQAHSSIRRELGLSETAIILGMVGNFYNDVRDQLTVCRALVPLLKLFPQAHFLFVGGRSSANPRYFDDCQQFCVSNSIQDRVHFLGLRQDAPAILSEMDVFVYASNHDTFGISLVEAMLSGLPCVINDIETLLEVSSAGRYAVVFKSKDPDHLASVLEGLLKDKAKQRLLGLDARAFATEHYTINSHIVSLEKQYRSLLDPQPGINA